MKRILIAVLVGLIVLIGLAVLVSSILILSPSVGFFSNKIAVIPIRGSIEPNKPSFVAELSSGELVERLQKAARDPTVSAVLLDIESPGGTIVATKQVVAAVRQVREGKKVVAWIGDLGTSGGYYVAAASDYIMADEDSLTGSIGVISIIPSIEGLLEEYGVEVKVLKGGEHKGMGNIFEDLDPEDAEILQEILFNAFQHFKRDIIEFRADRLNRLKFDSVSDGRILSGEQALEVGLIDELATRQQAIDKAAELAGVESPTIVDYGKKAPSLLELFSDAGYKFGFGLKQGLFESTQLSINS